MDIAFLIIRIIVGLGLAAHGSQKLFGWFGGHGLSGTGQFFSGIGYRPGHLFALGAGLAEFGGGMLTFLGLAGALGPALIVMVMVTAALVVHLGKGFFSDKGGPELPLLYIAGALAVAFAGAGAYSLDRAFGLTFLTVTVQIWYAMAAALIVALINAGVRLGGQATAAT
jgi:putative oxidoreductase